MAIDTPSGRGLAAPRPLAKKRIRPADALFFGGVLTAVLISMGALVWLLVSILVQGLPVLDWDFLTNRTSTNPERAGFNSSIRVTFVMMVITFAAAVPIGFAAALYLEKFANLSRDQLLTSARARERRLAELRAADAGLPRLALAVARTRMSFAWARLGPPVNRAVDVNISNLAAVPSIIYGLLGLALFVSIVGLQKNMLAGALTLALLVLPIIIIASREAVKAVPVSIEQGAMALGATRWQAVSRQVFPAALPGMLTGTILALSRAIGESAPLIVVGGVVFATQVPSLNPLHADDTPLLAMPLQIFFWAGEPRQEFQDLAAAGIIVLLGTLIVMNLVAIVLRNKFSRRW
ncbi:PstA family ABC transporter permease [Miltoncostaea marina]|uniref:PstA family ABC transporter permease n=1 Tax=Miltoncostaea marina TaxID=2843215 RepID=UPI001C3D2236|nr:PstA family ABC transporter permease [Miltoncostaea marina]